MAADVFLVELVKGGFTLAAVALASVIALKVYFRQKEYELTKQRYLEGGVDIVAAEVETAFGVVSHNYARSLELCKSFRDSVSEFQVGELERGFLALDRSKFHQTAHHRVSSLLGSEVVWEVFQNAMAYATSANSVIAQEVPEAMRILSHREESLFNRANAVEEMLVALRNNHDGGFKYATLIRELHALSLLLEAEKLSLKAIANFRDRSDAKAVVARLQGAFPREAEGNGVA